MKANGGLACGGMINQAHDACMRLTVYYGELTKVLVKCNDDSALITGAREEQLITWILRPVSGPDDVMPRFDEVALCTAPDASVQEELHSRGVSTNGSTRSWPTRRRA